MEHPIFTSPSIGRKIERLRKLKGWKQETLAKAIGVKHQTISKIENSDSIDDSKLEEIASALGVTAEDIKNFNEEAAFNNIFYDQNNSVINYQVNNPLDLCMSLVEENKKLYQQLVQSEREKVEILQKLLNKK